MAEICAIVNEKRQLLHQLIPLNVPLGITISTCNYCDFNCVYCGQAEEKRVPASLTIDTFGMIAEQLAEFEKPIKQVSFVSNGETILNKQLPEMIRILKRECLAESVKVISNGNQLSHDYADRLVDAGLDILKISLQGLSSQKYYEVCKTKVDFPRIMDQLTYFYQHRKQCKLHIKIIDIALEDGEEEKFYEIFQNIADVIFIEKCIGDLGKIGSNKYNMNIENMNVCSFPFFSFSIDEIGNVFPCCLTNRYHYEASIVGNIMTRSLKDLWEDRFYQLQLALLKKEKIIYPACNSCKKFIAYSKNSDILDGHEDQILKKYMLNDDEKGSLNAQNYSSHNNL